MDNTPTPEQVEKVADELAGIPDYKLAAEDLAKRLTDLGVTVAVKFVPRSQSPDPKKEQVNWLVTIEKGGKPLMVAPFSQGIGRLKGWKNNWSGRVTSSNKEALEEVLEKGRLRWLASSSPSGERLSMDAVAPTAVDVVSCLLSDASAIDSPSYESFAEELGYDKDSRTGEKIYRTCLEIGLKLRSAFGDTVLSELRDIACRL